MNINTLFLVGLVLIEFGIIIYLLFKVDNFQNKVKNFLRENLSKDEKILELRSTFIKVQIELQELKVAFIQLVDSKEKLTKEKDNLRSQGLKFTHINKEIKSLEIIEETSEKRFNDWLFSHPLYKEHYDRNFTLVMEEGIPTDIWNGIIM